MTNKRMIKDERGRWVEDFEQSAWCRCITITNNFFGSKHDLIENNVNVRICSDFSECVAANNG